MVDLFGIEQEPDGGAEAGPKPPEPSSPAPRLGQKLWAALLLFDAALVIVFGGTVAAKLYQHLTLPAALSPAQAQRRLPARPAPEAKPPQPDSTAQEERPSRAEDPRARNAAPAASDRAAEPQPARPTLLAEPPNARPAPKPQAASGAAHRAAAAPAAPAGAGEKVRAVPVEFKLAAPRARSVQLAGAFIVRGGRMDMARRGRGPWLLKLHLLPGATYRYWFIVDGHKTLDPANPRAERGASVLSLP